MTTLIIAGCFILFLGTYGFFWKMGTRMADRAVEATMKAIATTSPTGFTCPYCRVDVVGVRDLDLINHSLCITRSEEDLDRLRLEAKKKPVEDEYFVDARFYKYNSYSRMPSKHKDVYYYNERADYCVNEAKIYRNGELIDTVHAQSEKLVKDIAERHITIDKQKRKTRSKA